MNSQQIGIELKAVTELVLDMRSNRKEPLQASYD